MVVLTAAAAYLLTACGSGEPPASEAPEDPEPHETSTGNEQPEDSPSEYPDDETEQHGEDRGPDVDDEDEAHSADDSQGQQEPDNGPETPADPVITQDDDGGTVTLRQGERAALQLDSAWLWEEPRQQGATLQLTPVSHLVDPGYQEWEVETMTPGGTTLRIDGAPNCDEPAACPARTLEIRIEVEAT